MKTNNKLSAYILRGTTAAILFSCVLVALCSAIHLPEQPHKARAPQSNTAFGANGHESRSLSFAERVAYQRAIEEVYWRHRIWPDTNPDPKPTLDEVMSQAQIEKKVEDYLRNSVALEDHWQRPARNASHNDAGGPITADQLQAEMERIASHTKQPEVLREIFESLGNDPFVIAECLARPVLADCVGNGNPVAALPNAFGAAHPTRMPPQEPGVTGWLGKAETQMPRKAPEAVRVNRPYHLPVIAAPSGSCIDDTWTPTTLTNVPAARSNHTAVWTGSEMIVWGGFDGTNSNTGGRYNPTTDTWTATSITNAPEARQIHTAVWTGSEMIIWGGDSGSGYLNTGGRYNPTTDSWTATSTTNAPSARVDHAAVWAGSEMIVWGGWLPLQTNTGGRYNPSTDSWTATSTTNAPEVRVYHTAVWTGTEMIVWGGERGLGNFFNTGGRYNPSTDSWTATSTTNAPSGREFHSAVWSSSESEMIVWGGLGNPYPTLFITGGRYDPSTDSWTATSTTNAPVGRFFYTTVWTGSEMIVWGGCGDAGCLNLLNTGGRYNPVTNSWRATSTTNAPAARYRHTAVWTDSEMIVWGGTGDSGDLNTGGRYCAAAPSPTPTPTSSPTATATATATPTATPTATASSIPRPTPTPRARPTPAPRP